MSQKNEKFKNIRNKIYQRFERKTPSSYTLYLNASKCLAGGVSGNLRLLSPYPVYMSHGKGSRIYDIDGNEYLDCFLCSGALLLGHRHPAITEAMRCALEKGSLIFNTELAAECAALIKETVPCAERVRFSNSGTEAVTGAVRIARAYTRKNKIIKFNGHYHGQNDPFLTAIKDGQPGPIGPGITEASQVETVSLPFNDIDLIRKVMSSDNDIAAVILDPQMTMGGIFPAEQEFLIALRRLTHKHGIVLIFDEVVTGYRIALGGAQEYYGVTPDMAVIGKALGAGGKFAAIAGTKKIMESIVKEEERVFHSGTYNDGTVAIAASIAAIKTYKQLDKEGMYNRMWDKAGELKTNLETAFKKRDIKAQVNYFGPTLKLFITDKKANIRDICHEEHYLKELFLLSLLNEGVMLSWPSSGSIFLSFVLMDNDFEDITSAVNKSLDENHFNKILTK